MLFNINNKVRVKLTDYGREAHRKNHDIGNGFEYVPPKEDGEGWSEWQMWELMQEFGPQITMGFRPPFETEIEIIENNPTA